METDLDLLHIKANAHLGAARIPLESLQFLTPGSRIPNDECQTRLLGIFNKFSCERLDHVNRIPVVISLEFLQGALAAAKLSMESIKATDPPFLPLPLEPCVLALRGRHRWEAAKKRYHKPEDRWWTVILLNEAAISHRYQKLISEEWDNTMPFFDGEIYYNIRLNQLQSDWLQAAKWMNRIISSSKQTDYERLHKYKSYKPFCEALDLLLAFPAIMLSFRLGNIRRFFRMKCPEELAASVRHIHTVWTGIMEGFDTDLLGLSDVKSLEGRSPVWSSADRMYISNLFNSGTLFPNITDRSCRTVLKERVMAIDTIIPSMTTFLENTKYLEPAAILLRGLLPTRFPGSIRQQMRKIYETIDESSQDQFFLSYQRLWLTALRIFPYITGFKPRQDRRGERIEFEGNYHGLFARSAVKYGFSSPKIQRILQDYPSDDMLPGHAGYPAITSDTATRWRLTDRCGMPTESMFQSTKPFLSLENVYYSPKPSIEGTDLTPFAVARDTFLSFFGKTQIPITESSTSEGQRIASYGALSPLNTARGNNGAPEVSLSNVGNELQDTNMCPEPSPGTTGPDAAEMDLENNSNENKQLTLPPLAVTHSPDLQLVVPSALLTPFPPTINLPPPRGGSGSQSFEPDPWQINVLKEAQRMSPKEAKEHFRNTKYEYALYVWDDYEGSRFYYPTAEQLLLVNRFVASRKHWWYARLIDGRLKSIFSGDVQSVLEEDHFVICGYEQAGLYMALKGQEAEL